VAQLSAAHGWTALDDGRKVVWARVDVAASSAGVAEEHRGARPPATLRPGTEITAGRRALARPKPAATGARGVLRLRGLPTAPRRLGVLWRPSWW
jgi:hypothetical protein